MTDQLYDARNDVI